MIEIKDGRYYKAFWCFEFQKGISIPGLGSDIPIPPPKSDGNMLAAIFTDDPERKKWELVFRFRYYVDDKIGLESEDERNWYAFDATGEEDDIFKPTRVFFEKIALMHCATLQEAIVESDRQATQMEKLASMPSMHVQAVPLDKSQLN